MKAILQMVKATRKNTNPTTTTLGSLGCPGLASPAGCDAKPVEINGSLSPRHLQALDEVFSGDRGGASGEILVCFEIENQAMVFN